MMATKKTSESMTLGLRFDSRDRTRLRLLTVRAESMELKEAAALMRAACEACVLGEPMRLECASVEEAQLVAGGFSQYGVTPPSIEQLSGL